MSRTSYLVAWLQEPTRSWLWGRVDGGHARPALDLPLEVLTEGGQLAIQHLKGSGDCLPNSPPRQFALSSELPSALIATLARVQVGIQHADPLIQVVTFVGGASKSLRRQVLQLRSCRFDRFGVRDSCFRLSSENGCAWRMSTVHTRFKLLDVNRIGVS